MIGVLKSDQGVRPKARLKARRLRAAPRLSAGGILYSLSLVLEVFLFVGCSSLLVDSGSSHNGAIENGKGLAYPFEVLKAAKEFCTIAENVELSLNSCNNETTSNIDIVQVNSDDIVADKGVKCGVKSMQGKPEVDFTKIDINLLPTVLIVGRPNVGKSALFNRLIRRREALVYNTPADHVTRDIREGLARLGDLRFRVLDSAGLETEATSGSILDRSAGMTANVLAKTHFLIFLIDVRTGVHPLDMEVGKWLRKHAPGINPIVAMNKSESLCDGTCTLAAAIDEAHMLGFGDPIAISAETGLGMTELYKALRPLLEDYMIQVLNDNCNQEKGSSQDASDETDESKLPLQLAIVGRPNVGKSTLLNTLLQEDRVMVGPEAGLTRDAVRAQFEFQGRTVYLVDTAGWLQRTKQEKGPASLSIMQSRKNLMRAHVVALVLDAEEIAKSSRSMTHAEVVIARRAVEEGRGLVVIVNKMDLLRGKQLNEKVREAVPLEIRTVIPQVVGFPVIFISALEGRGRIAVMREVINTYEKWCLRLSTARLNRWLRKVMSRHSWKDQAVQPKIKYFTQVKARPPTFVAFVSGKTRLSDPELRFLTKSLKEDFDLDGIPIRILQRSILKNTEFSGSKNSQSTGRKSETLSSDKRNVLA
ncbi:putative GTP-binding protein enga [Tripterygium wilfordii]|uniref:GTPase Der n=1 Tax=Tripterygium wilfordii TaxID=458696 RepID=A0A7J7CCG4_TRIWF|nr:putative GTP-binding protein enga [Tripterygium wilfordii]